MRPSICAGQEFHNAGNGIARKEGKIDAGIPSLGDVVKHPGGPVLVVTDREEYFGAKQPLPTQEFAGFVCQRVEAGREAIPEKRVRPIETDVVANFLVGRAPGRAAGMVVSFLIESRIIQLQSREI
jgi:hypothetical protein